MNPDSLDDLLRREFARPVPDEGFAGRVAAALAPRERRRDWTLPLTALASLAGFVVAAGAFPVGPALVDGFREVATLHWSAPSALGVLATLATLAVAGGVLATDD